MKKEKNVVPVFIFSLPRSGSTLLQIMLATHKEVATVSEPWVLLPLFYTMKDSGIYTEYDHRCVKQAMDDMCDCLPNKKKDLTESFRVFALDLYAKLSGVGVRYFLDKTPRYHLIVDDIFETFPDAKFIFLWRNPLAVAASINETWAGGKWKLYAYKVDIYRGLENLIEAHERHLKNSLSIRYEDIAIKPEQSMRAICDYLDIVYDEQMVGSFTQNKLAGSLGDPTGIKKFNHISVESLDKWVTHFSNPIRRAWAIRYLKWIGRERISSIGYDFDDIRKGLLENKLNYRSLISDASRMLLGETYCLLEPVIFVDKLKLLRKRLKIYAHR